MIIIEMRLNENINKKIPENLSEIQELIRQKSYENAYLLTISLLNKSLEEEDEINISFSLEIIKAICDKTSDTIDMTFSIIQKLLNHTEYWIREHAINYLKKIYYTNSVLIEPYIEKIEAKLFDADKNVRISAIKLISLILQKSLDKYPHLYITYSRMFEDHSWTVRATALECSLDFLTPESNPSQEIINAFGEDIFPLFRDPDEEVRGLAAEFFKALSHHLTPEEIIEKLEPILKDIDWEIREKGVWILGEIASTNFENFIPLLHHLIELFTDENLMIQTKAIDAFVKIGKKRPNEILDLFLPYIEKGDKEIFQGITECLIFIALDNTKTFIPRIINALDNESEKIQDLIKEILMKIYMESPESIEQEIFNLFKRIDNENWRKRRKTAKLLGDINYILKIGSISVWTVINLKDWKEQEKDFDVIDEISASIKKIYNVFENLDENIEELENEQSLFYEKIKELEKEPRNLRKNVDLLIREKKFNDAEIALENESRKIIKKIGTLEKELNESEFKRCSVEIFQDFKDSKDEIMEQISDIKSIMFNQIYDERESYLEDLKDVKKILHDRIDVLESEYESVKKIESSLGQIIENEKEERIKEFIESIASLRKKIYKLEYDIGQTWIKNLDFKDFLKSLTIYWIDTKLDIQKYLADVFYKFRKFKDSDGDSKIKDRIAFEFLNQQFQNTIIQAIQSQQDYLRNFAKIIKPIEDEIEKKNFNQAKNRLNATENNLYNNIENNNREINNLYEEIESVEMPIASANEIRDYLQNWNNIKDKILLKMREFKKEIEERIFIDEVLEFMEYINPIPLDNLSAYLSMDLSKLKGKILDLITHQKIKGKIKENELISPDKKFEEKFISIYRKVEILGNKLNFSIKIYNPTKYFIKDVELIFLYPKFLKMIYDESDPTELLIREFEPEANRMINWRFKIDKEIDKKYDLQRFLMNLSYENPFKKRIDIQKEMEMII